MNLIYEWMCDCLLASLPEVKLNLVPFSLRGRWSPGKRQQHRLSIPETAVTLRLAPGVFLLRWNRWSWKKGGVIVERSNMATADSLCYKLCVSITASHFCPFTKPSGKGQLGSRFKYTDRDRRGRQRETLVEACMASLTVYPLHPSSPPDLLYHRPGLWYGLRVLHSERWMAGNGCRLETDKPSSPKCQRKWQCIGGEPFVCCVVYLYLYLWTLRLDTPLFNNYTLHYHLPCVQLKTS